MRLPLLLQVYFALRRGYRQLTPEAQRELKRFVASQKVKGQYLNAGGKPEPYYTQFGRVLEAVFSPWKAPLYGLMLSVPESLGRDDVYGQFFDFIRKEMNFRRPKVSEIRKPESLTSTAVCCILAMQYQSGVACDTTMIKWLCERQHESGGFCASEVTTTPDLLTTAVALFTLRLIGQEVRLNGYEVRDTSTFISLHWLDTGGFAPTLLDDYSDVEYVFYGLLGLGKKPPLTPPKEGK